MIGTSERAPLPRALERPARGRVLAFVPHSDDDVIGCGGTACLHHEQGDPVRVVVVFSGAAGDPDGRYAEDELPRVREREARAGGAHLGLSDYAFWGYPEGHEPSAHDLVHAARRVAGEVESYAPDVVYAPWIGEHHVDHHTTARAVRLGLELAGFAGEAWGFEVWTPLVPTLIVDVTAVYERKLAALREHASQMAYGDMVHKTTGMQAQRSLYLSGGARYGEAFAPLGAAPAEERALVEASAEGGGA